jgi:exodeoxyribonuclease VII small subunit
MVQLRQASIKFNIPLNLPNRFYMTNKSAGFEKNMSRLEEILEKMNNNVALDEALDLFEEADKLVKICQKKLDEAQNRIEKVVTSQQENSDKVHLEKFEDLSD